MSGESAQCVFNGLNSCIEIKHCPRWQRWDAMWPFSVIEERCLRVLIHIIVVSIKVSRCVTRI